jgi:serine/threonine protein kinase
MKLGTQFHSQTEIYTSTAQLGQGGNGVVFQVTSTDSKHWALKTLRPEVVSREKAKRFRNEREFCKRQIHPNILRVEDDGFIVVSDKKCPFYVMPLYRGTLRDLMKSGLSPVDAMRIFGKILDGVEAAHFLGIWHRDLKPENVLCGNSTDDVVLADFGIAHFSEEFLHTTIETKVGSKLHNDAYAAPEQRNRLNSVDHRADIYALGAMLNELFTGTVPHGSDYKQIGEVNSSYAYLDPLVRKMLSQDPTRRPSSVGIARAEIQVLSKQSVTLQRVSKLESTVVPAETVDDPLVTNPVKVVAVVDYTGNELVLELSNAPNAIWTNIFSSESFPMDYQMSLRPSMVRIYGRTASITVEAHRTEAALNFVKRWIEAVNGVYANKARESARQEADAKRRQLEAEIAKERTRAEVLGRLKV